MTLADGLYWMTEADKDYSVPVVVKDGKVRGIKWSVDLSTYYPAQVKDARFTGPLREPGDAPAWTQPKKANGGDR